jgi:hypothetical protein
VRQLSEENFGKFSLLCCSAEIFVAMIIQGEESSFVIFTIVSVFPSSNYINK